MPENFVVFSNSIIRASILKGSPLTSLLHFKTLLSSSHHPFRPDTRTFSLILKASRLSSSPEPALQTHARFIKTGSGPDPLLLSPLFHFYLQFHLLSETHHLFNEMLVRFKPDPVPGNLLLKALLRNGEVGKATKVFDKMPLRDLFTWNSMIAGSVRNSRPKEGLVFFTRMVELGVEPDGFTFSAVLSACARTGALNHGAWVHGLMAANRVGLESGSYSVVVAALVDMYSKCGRVEAARTIFNSIDEPDRSVCNAMMTGFASHGLGADAVKLFQRMEELKVSPDGITFVGLLMALSHSGLVELARFYFDSMNRTYSIERRLKHYGSFVDALTRAGQLDEALKTIEAIPIEPDHVVWRSLLSGCRRHGRLDLAELAIQRMADLGSGDYAMISSLYSSSKHFDCAEGVWSLMRKQRVRKDLGLSWVELGGKLHQFKAGFTGNQSHNDIESVRKLLTRITTRVKEEGYVPMTRIVAMDVDDEEKEENLRWHSEKIAVAYSVLKTSPGTEIRVSKNLMTCGDCHEWMKVVSRVLRRVVVVRDRVRFHRFEKGACSCGDYW